MKKWTLRISPRRAAFGGTICLILGVVTTVGVAWACVYIRDDRYPLIRSGVTIINENDKGRVTEHHSIKLHGSFGTRFILSLRVRDTSIGSRVLEQFPPFQIPSWAEEVSVPTAGYSTGSMRTEERQLLAAGWPSVALHCKQYDSSLKSPAGDSVLASTGITPLTEGAIVITRGDHAVFLPYRILPFGFALDVVVYAILWFGFLFAPGVTRRFIRTRRGRCPRCGYDLQNNFTDGCSECWWGRSHENEDSG